MTAAELNALAERFEIRSKGYQLVLDAYTGRTDLPILVASATENRDEMAAAARVIRAMAKLEVVVTRHEVALGYNDQVGYTLFIGQGGYSADTLIEAIEAAK